MDLWKKEVRENIFNLKQIDKIHKINMLNF